MGTVVKLSDYRKAKKPTFPDPIEWAKAMTLYMLDPFGLVIEAIEKDAKAGKMPGGIDDLPV
jgi:hypothetical protein